MAQKMTRRLVALSASAIAAIYAAGFSLTRSADAVLAQAANGSDTATTAAATATPLSDSAVTPVVGVSAPTATTAATGTAIAAATATSAYKDGTYTASGTSRRGGVSVSVTVKAGTITNVQITSVNTEYPVSRIASLPSAVIKQQSSKVNIISGATYSSQAFIQAVQNALALAKGN